MGKYCYNTGGDTCHKLDADTFEEATAGAKMLVNDPSVEIWVGDAITPDPPTIEGVGSAIGQQMEDEVGEPASEWPELSKTQSDRMHADLNAVLMRHLEAAGQWPPPFFKVENLQKVQDARIGEEGDATK